MVRSRKKLAGGGRGAKPWRDVWAAVSLKLALLAALYLLFFTPAHRPPSDASATARAIVGANAASSLR
jgi:hypothetical protein